MNKQERYYLWVWLLYWASINQANTYRSIYNGTKFDSFYWGGLSLTRKGELQDMAKAIRDDPPK